MTKKSTSINKISADKKMTKFEHIKWLLNCFLDNMFGNVIFCKKFNLSKYIYDNNNIINYFKNIEIIETPTRICCDLFWNESLSKIDKEKLNIIEIGCGTGKYADYLLKRFPSKINTYVGIDIVENKEWKLLKLKYHNVNFIVDDYQNTDSYLDNIDLIITQSAIEHFEYDLLFFDKILNYIDKYNKNITQIHLLPSAPCLYLYFWHGFRQYTQKKINKIAKLNINFDFNLFELGDNNINKIHFNFITFQKLLNKEQKRYTHTNMYFKKLENAFLKCNSKNYISKFPSFYALLINKKL
jgi:SAM-dependent methyltransferase